MKNKFKKLSKYTFVISLIIFALSYYVYHFVTDAGFTLTWHAECGKPFVTDMVASLGVMFLFASLISLLIAHIFFGEENANFRRN